MSGDADADATRSQAPDIAATPASSPASSVSAAASLEPGASFVDEPEQYAVEGRIGAGGMGTVLSAKGSRFGRSVALKVVTADRDDLRRRFEREAQVTARLQHPAIVPVYGSGRGRDGHPFYAMKHVTGEPLTAAIAKADTPAKRMALVPNVIAVTEAIAYAHSERVVHRDLKPHNILVGAFGETVVIDWGLAKDLSRDDDDPQSPYRSADAATADGTALGKVMGTPAYMPLEQARSERIDARADVYALGAILYHVLAGAPPYARPGETGVPWETMLARVIAGPPEPLASSDLPPDLLAIVARAMARDPAARYASAGELADDLKRFQTGQLVGAHRYSSWQLVKRWLRKHRGAVTVAAVALGVLAVVAVTFVNRIVDEQHRTEAQRVAAVASRGDAEGLVTFMLGDLRAKLQPIGKLDLLGDIAARASTYYEGRGDDLTDDELARRALALRELGDVLAFQNHADLAKARFEQALAIVQQLLARDPTSVPRLRDLAKCHDELGDVASSQGHSDAALAEYRASQAISEQLAARSHEGIDDHGVIVAHKKAAALLAERSDVAGARADAQAGLERATALAAREPTVADWARDVSVMHAALGQLDLTAGDLAGALGEFQQSLALDERAAKLTDDVDHQRNIAIDYLFVGNVLGRTGDYAGAVAQYRSYLAIMQQLAANDPTHAIRHRDVATGHQRIGAMLAKMHDYKGALVEHRAALVVAAKLAADDPTNAERELDLAATHSSVGAALQELGDLAGALAEHRAELAINEAMAARDPANLDSKARLALAHAMVGDAEKAVHDLPGALADYRTALDVQLALAAKDPTNDELQRNVAVSHFGIAEVLTEQGKLADALPEYRAEYEIMARRAAAAPINKSVQSDLVSGANDYGKALMAHRDGAAAAAVFGAMVAAAQAGDPDDLAEARQRLAEAQHLATVSGVTP